jgi:5-hydroxyisourate hydrolase
MEYQPGGSRVPGDRPTISTHVLDTGTGRPAAGVRIRCLRVAGDAVDPVGGGTTDDDGRIRDLLDGGALVPGVYRLEFELGPGRFFESAIVDVRIDDAGRSYHVPLLIAPYGLSSYRGS